jgi:prepilin-type N-terminal cleavage/methylation domain-containing protein
VRQRGFTLIELLVVVAIIGIIAAIALPQFDYQKKGFDARTVADLRSVATAQETYFTDHATYASSCAVLPGYVQSPGVVISTCTGDAASFRVVAAHPQGTKTCTWDSTLNPALSCS